MYLISKLGVFSSTGTVLKQLPKIPLRGASSNKNRDAVMMMMMTNANSVFIKPGDRGNIRNFHFTGE